MGEGKIVVDPLHVGGVRAARVLRIKEERTRGYQTFRGAFLRLDEDEGGRGSGRRVREDHPLRLEVRLAQGDEELRQPVRTVDDGEGPTPPEDPCGGESKIADRAVDFAPRRVHFVGIVPESRIRPQIRRVREDCVHLAAGLPHAERPHVAFPRVEPVGEAVLRGVAADEIGVFRLDLRREDMGELPAGEAEQGDDPGASSELGRRPRRACPDKRRKQVAVRSEGQAAAAGKERQTLVDGGEPLLGGEA